MRLRLLGPAGVLVVVAACSTPPAETTMSPPADFDAAAMLTDVRALSADDIEGRSTATDGERRAADWIESRFRETGMEPVAGSYRQAVRLVGMQRNSDTAQLAIVNAEGALALEDGVNVAFWSTAQQPNVQIDAPLVFVGYGVEAPEYNWDDFNGIDVAGKVLLFLNNDPPVVEDDTELFGGDARTYYGRWTYKFEQAMKHGAAGALMVHTTPSASYPFSVIQHSGSRESFALDLPGAGYQVPMVGWLDENLSGQIAASIGTDLDGLFDMAARRDFAPVETSYAVRASIDTEVRRINTENVLGMFPGSDPDLADEVMVFSAHYDHMGHDPSLEGEDKTFNGAWDNAAGVAAIAALADAFAAGEPTRRSLLFLACAAEESGSLGSAWFVADPPFAKNRLVANFNIDMPQIFGVTSDIAAIGVDTSSLGTVLEEVAGTFMVERGGQEVAVRVTGDPNPSAGSFYRSDQVNFAKAGVPALFMNPGGDYVTPLGFDPREYRSSHYHQLSDEVRAEWDLSGLARDLAIVMATVRQVDAADEMPRWNPGNEFETAWRALHGIDQ
ncbi:MAG: M28 family peptidase [Acidobacteria bacterium]|nr:M28 family peptidase [Acidobacteriota bacterium]